MGPKLSPPFFTVIVDIFDNNSDCVHITSAKRIVKDMFEANKK